MEKKFKIIFVIFLTFLITSFLFFNFISADFGNGSMGSVTFTSSVKNYGNMVNGSDYLVAGNTLYLKTDYVYNFTSFTLGDGMFLAPLNSTGAVIYLVTSGTMNINGTILSSFLYAYNPTPGNGTSTTFNSGSEIITTPGVMSGGSGGPGYSIGGSGGSGGSQNNGFGGSGGGGATAGQGSYNANGGNGGNGNWTGAGGGGGSITITDANGKTSAGTSSATGGGGGGASGKCNSGGSASASGGSGGDSSGNNGIDGTTSVPSCVSGANGVAGGGGGGSGGLAGYSGINVYIRAYSLNFTGQINTSGTSGGNGGNGGNGKAQRGYPSGGADGGGGGSGGGGGAGNGGNVNVTYGSIIADTGTVITSGGANGVHGTSGTAYDYNNNEIGIASNGSDGTSGTSGYNSFLSIDITPPNISIVFPTNNTNTTNKNININYTASDNFALSTCWYSNDSMSINTTLTGCANITTITWIDGRHNVTVWANDTNNNVNSSSVTFTVDTTNPNVNIVYPSNNTNTTNKNININYTRSDNVFLSNCWYSNDSYSKNTSLSNCANITITWAEGNHNVSVYVNDSVGHLNVSEVSFTVDSVNPSISIISPPNNTNSSNNQLNINYTASDVHLSSCWYSNDSMTKNTTLASCSTNITNTWSDGPHNVTIWANDTFGNLNSSSVSFLIDTINPQINFTSNTQQNATYKQTNDIFINVSASDTNLKNVNLSFNNTNQSFSNSGGGYYWINKTGLAEGTYNFYAYAYDTANNFNKTEIRTVYIDLNNPIVTISSPKSQSYNYQNISLNYTATDINLASCWFTNDSGIHNYTLTNCQNSSVNMPEGSYNLSVYANDSSGRIGNNTVSFIISLTPPSVSLDYPTNNQWLNYSSNINFSVTPSGSNLKSCDFWTNTTGAWSINSTNSSLVSGASSIFKLNLSNGNFIWNARCNNTGGNFAWGSPFYNYTIHVDTINPLINFTSNTPRNDTNSSIMNIYAEVNASDTNEQSITFTLFNNIGSYNITTFTNGARSINWTSLPDGIYYYNVSIIDYAGNFNSTETRTIRLDNTPPVIILAEPKAQNYGNNNSMSLNYSITDNFIGLKNCSYYIYNSSGSLIIPLTVVSCTNNQTFSLPGGDINYNITVTATDLLNNFNSTTRTFGIRTNSPAVQLYPSNNTQINYVDNIYFNYSVTTNADSISACSLYSNFGGSWMLNETISNPTKTIMNNFDPVSLSENNYLWNVNCSDNFGHSSWGLNNETFVVDLTNPNVYNLVITPTLNPQTFQFNATVNDTNLNLCEYTILNSSGDVDGISNNVVFICNTLTSATATNFGNFTLNVSAFDKAGNENSTTQQFTLTPSSGGTGSGGGGGGGSSTTNVLVVALIKPDADINTYTDLQRAILYKVISEFCNNTIAGQCSADDTSLAKLVTVLSGYQVIIDSDDLKLWFDNFNVNKIENVQISKADADKLKLVVSQVVVKEGEFTLSPSTIDELKFVISGNEIERTIESNLELASCKVESGDVGFSCDVSNTVGTVYYDLSNGVFSFKKVSSTISFTSKDGKVAYLNVTFRIIRGTGIYIIVGVLLVLLIIFFFRKKIKNIFKSKKAYK